MSQRAFIVPAAMRAEYPSCCRLFNSLLIATSEATKNILRSNAFVLRQAVFEQAMYG